MIRRFYSDSVSWFRSAFQLSIIVSAVFILAGCAGDDMSDLKAFINKERPRPPVTPLPDIPPYVTFQYAANQFRDPFEPIIEEQPAPPPQEAPTKITSTLRPDFNRNREPLERYPLDGLRMVGTLEQRDQRWGLVRGPDGTVYRVQVGNFLGQNHGRITEISEEQILLIEIIPDGNDGWQERPAKLALSE